MANILRGYGLARESGFFKLEQEADLQRHRKRLVKEGKLTDEPKPTAAAEGGGAEGGGTQAGAQQQRAGFTASEHLFETLPEVLQQQARIDDPHALRRTEYERRVKGEPPPLSETELLRARSKVAMVGAAVGHVPRLSFGRNRWAVPQAGEGGGGIGDHLAASYRAMTPEAREVASRTYVAGVRSLVYGSLLGTLGLACGVTWATRSWDIKSGADLGDRMRAGLAPLSDGLRRWLVPFKVSIQAWLAAPPTGTHDGGSGAAAAAVAAGGGMPADGGRQGGGATAEFSRRLQERYNPKGGPVDPSPGSELF